MSEPEYDERYGNCTSCGTPCGFTHQDDCEYIPGARFNRPETGALKFGDDWSGVFIRGDNAIHYAMHLRNVLEGRDVDGWSRMILSELLGDLIVCDERNGLTAQQLRSFAECLPKRKDKP